jgi:hypothetical protein
MVTATSAQILSPEQERRAAELRRQGAELARREINFILPGCKLVGMLTTITSLDLAYSAGDCSGRVSGIASAMQQFTIAVKVGKNTALKQMCADVRGATIEEMVRAVVFYIEAHPGNRYFLTRLPSRRFPNGTVRRSTMASTPGRSRPSSATRTSATRCATPSCRPIDSSGSGELPEREQADRRSEPCLRCLRTTSRPQFGSAGVMSGQYSLFNDHA